MKKFLVLLVVALLCVSGVAYAGQVALGVSPGAGEIIAKNGANDIPDKTFRIVRFMVASNDVKPADTPSLTADSIVIWDTTSDDGVTVCTTTTSYDSAVAGVVPIAILTPDAPGATANVDLGRRNWGWLQTYGKCEVYGMTLGTAAVKSALGTSSQAGAAGVYVSSATVPTTQGNAGFYYDAYTAGATDVEAFVRLN
jgi:hypothetical protein